MEPAAVSKAARPATTLLNTGVTWPDAAPCPPWHQALGDVFSALSAAVGAADKVRPTAAAFQCMSRISAACQITLNPFSPCPQVVELMKRQPAVPETGALVPAAFAGKITLQASWPCRRASRCPVPCSFALPGGLHSLRHPAASALGCAAGRVLPLPGPPQHARAQRAGPGGAPCCLWLYGV